MTRYVYTDDTQRELEHMVHCAIPVSARLSRATVTEDFGGVDVHYVLNGRCRLQTRCRFDRPAWAADQDITFRTTEPAMIRARTYAPLALFAWFREGRAYAGKLIDIYSMAERVELDRPATSNGDGTAFIVIRFSELFDAGAVLRLGDRHGWVAACLQGNERTLRIMGAEEKELVK
jgi:hypothetical protein